MKKNATLLFLILFVFVNYGQNLIKMEGKIQLVSYHQGGVELPDEYRMAKPCPNEKVILVKYNGANEYSTFVALIQSDSNGCFEIELQEGYYGFVAMNQKHQLNKVKGLYLPIPPINKVQTDFSGVGTNDYWTINSAEAFEVKNGKTETMIFTHYDITVCYMCP